jgi:hypothetical protein
MSVFIVVTDKISKENKPGTTSMILNYLLTWFIVANLACEGVCQIKARGKQQDGGQKARH